MPDLLKTKTFELAVYKQGDEKADKLALCLPGLLDTKDYAHMKSHVDFLATRGYLAMSFDPPGTWESPGDLSLYTNENYLQAVDELIELHGNRPTITLGHSLGGNISILAGIRNPHITHFIAVMPAWASGGQPADNFKTSYRDLPPGVRPTEKKVRFAFSLF